MANETELGTEKVADAILRANEGGDAWSLLTGWYQATYERTLPLFVAEPFLKEWSGWGVSLDMIAAACAILNLRGKKYNPTTALHKIISDFARRAGKIQ